MFPFPTERIKVQVDSRMANMDMAGYLWWAGLEYRGCEVFHERYGQRYDISVDVSVSHDLSHPGTPSGFQMNMGWSTTLGESEMETPAWARSLDDQLALNAMLAWALRSRKMDGFIVADGAPSRVKPLETPWTYLRT